MAGKIINVKRIEETILWKKLQVLGDTNSNTLMAELPTICEEAADRMKAMPATSPQYTLHDESHFLRVVELMAMVLYFAVDWSKFQNKELKAPYKIWLDSNEVIEINESDLIKWRDS